MAEGVACIAQQIALDDVPRCQRRVCQSEQRSSSPWSTPQRRNGSGERQTVTDDRAPAVEVSPTSSCGQGSRKPTPVRRPLRWSGPICRNLLRGRPRRTWAAGARRTGVRRQGCSPERIRSESVWRRDSAGRPIWRVPPARRRGQRCGPPVTSMTAAKRVPSSRVWSSSGTCLAPSARS
jgi:hypothetical protein